MAAELRPGPLFVVGMYRSGTSLLYALLNQHPQIALTYEADLSLLFLVPRKQANWLTRWDFWNGAPSRHGIDIDHMPSAISDSKTAAEAVYKQHARQKGAVIWGDKSPNCYDSLTSLLQKFPSARFVIIWRDPAAICSSIIRAAEGSSVFRKKGMVHRAIIGNQRLKEGCDRLMSLGVPVCQVQYENLVNDPRSAMEEICDFLSISFDSRMTSLAGADRSAIPAEEHNTLARSESILAKPNRTELLSPSLKKKIDRYVTFWRERYGDWPAFPRSLNDPRSKPSRLERALDECFFWALRRRDQAVRFIYSVAPLSLLTSWAEKTQAVSER
jgi:hypothetical protein